MRGERLLAEVAETRLLRPRGHEVRAPADAPEREEAERPKAVLHAERALEPKREHVAERERDVVRRARGSERTAFEGAAAERESQLRAAKPKKAEADLAPNPADENYDKLCATLEVASAEELKFIQGYIDATAASHNKPKLINAFRIDRDGEGKRFKEHDDIEYRKLLWHGTNVAVVAAICKTGLRIMPHSGGRVGKGIYLASENGKSINYMGWAGKTGVMFLAEAALGKQHSITSDDSSLVKPPKGFDSIIARGHKEPDPKKDLEWKFDGKKVVVPQGEPVTFKEYAKSSFNQSEYLVYQENQVRLRYCLQVQSG